jgi:hypothetical protein
MRVARSKRTAVPRIETSSTLDIPSGGGNNVVG